MALFVAKNWIPRCEPKKMANVRCKPTPHFIPLCSHFRSTILSYFTTVLPVDFRKNMKKGNWPTFGRGVGGSWRRWHFLRCLREVSKNLSKKCDIYSIYIYSPGTRKMQLRLPAQRYKNLRLPTCNPKIFIIWLPGASVGSQRYYCATTYSWCLNYVHVSSMGNGHSFYF